MLDPHLSVIVGTVGTRSSAMARHLPFSAIDCVDVPHGYDGSREHHNFLEGEGATLTHRVTTACK